jgi:short-subunit dehydrogenase
MGEINHIIWIAPESKIDSMTDDALIDDQQEGVIQIFRIIKSMLGLGYGEKKMGWSVFTTETLSIHKEDKLQPAHSSVQGLIGSMAKEYPNWKIRFVDVEEKCRWVNEDVFKIPEDPQGNPLVYRGSEWYRQKFAHVHYPSLNGSLYRQGGVYIVIGGAGGLGEVWSEYLIRKYRATLIWLGRRKKNPIIQAKLDRLGKLGETPWYINADAANRNELSKAYKRIKEKYPEIHGVVHSAIALQDQSMAKMNEERFKEGLAAKIDISVRIAQIFKDEALDFVLFFSSFMSFAKTAGQSNYAAGCTFKDAFAKRLSAELNCAVKVKNWGYWGNTGVVASKEYQERMEKMGIGSIDSIEAMEALENLMRGPIDQTLFIKTTKPNVINDISDREIIQIYPESPLVDVQKLESYIFNPV